MMNNRLKAWVGFNDGNCDEDTQLLIDDIKELEKKLAEAAGFMEVQKDIAFRRCDSFLYNDLKRLLKSLEEKEGE